MVLVYATLFLYVYRYMHSGFYMLQDTLIDDAGENLLVIFLESSRQKSEF